MIKLEFHGAAKTVTGSNYLVKTDHATFIVDCGMFQGVDVESRNLEDYPYDASKVDFVLLTHAHIDHSGMLPKLYKEGFRGKIYATHHTIQISELLLQDSAKIQENNYTRGVFFGKYTRQVALAYNTEQAIETINLFSAVNFDEEFEPVSGIKVKYIRAGHILGAASIEVDVQDEGTEKEILFSGDIGRSVTPLIPDYDKNYRSSPDYILLESLYGGQEHPDRNESVSKLVDVINNTISNGGNVYIPVFAVQRTQEILHDLKRSKEEGKLAKDLAVWLDSPLAQKVSYIYRTAVADDPENEFSFDGLRYTQNGRQSQKIAKRKGQVILAGSGMADGGRIVEHLVTGLEDPKNTICFVGFQAEGTLGRELTEGNKEIQIGKNKVNVKAKIVHLTGFSAHGDTSDYIDWVKRFDTDNLKKIFLIHAEADRAEDLKKILTEEGMDQGYVPEWKEGVEL